MQAGAQLTYTHTLKNTGSLSDTYRLRWSSTQPWTTVLATTPVTLTSGQSSIVTVKINVPSGISALGQHDTTIITATSSLSPTKSFVVTDFTLVPRARIFLPLIRR